MTEEELARLEALARAATEGPWEALSAFGGDWSVVGDDGAIAAASAIWDDCALGLDADDARFIAASRQAVPALVAEVRRLRAENAALRRAMTGTRHTTGAA